MKLGIISDIHGNLPALEAVLAELDGEGVDRVVCLGDVASAGPQPREVIARLRSLGCPVVMGNTDAALFEPPPVADATEGQRVLRDIEDWGATQVTPEDLAYVRGFLPTVALDLDGRSLLCYHGSPRSFMEAITPETPDDDLAAMLAGHPTAALYAGGHTHNQMLRRHRDALVLNPGTVGLAIDAVPFARARTHMAWAEYAVVAARGARLEVALRRTPFDLDALLAAATASGMPFADLWAADWRAP